MKKAIVTGASGFVGRYLVKELLSNNIEVVAVIRDKSRESTLEKHKNLSVVCCSMDKISFLPEMLSDRNFDAFFHFAWDGVDGAARGDWPLQLANIKYTVDASQVAFEIACKRFIGAGSFAEKDCNAYIPIAGSRPDPVSCYGLAKITAHYMSKVVCSRNGLEHIWIYIPNTYGPGDRTQNFVNFAASAILDGKRAAFTKGEHLYEFVYISDTIAGIIAAALYGKPFCSYYIGGKARPLKDYIIAIRDTIDKNVPLYLGEIPFHGVTHPIESFDASALEADTGFHIRIPFEQGVIETISWLKNVAAEKLPRARQ